MDILYRIEMEFTGFVSFLNSTGVFVLVFFRLYTPFLSLLVKDCTFQATLASLGKIRAPLETWYCDFDTWINYK